MFDTILRIFAAVLLVAVLFGFFRIYKDSKKNRALVNPELVPVTAEMLGVPGDLLNFVALSQGMNFTVNQAFKAMRQVGDMTIKPKNVAVMLRKLARQKVIRRAGSAFQLRIG